VLAAADAHVITVGAASKSRVPSKMYGIIAAAKSDRSHRAGGNRRSFAGREVRLRDFGGSRQPESVTDAVKSLVKDADNVQSMGRAARAVAPE